MHREQIVDVVINRLIYDGLDLEDLGIEREDINPETSLFTAEGLDLDSVDALEILAAVQREFKIKLGEVDAEFIQQHCSTPSAITETVFRFHSARPS